MASSASSSALWSAGRRAAARRGGASFSTGQAVAAAADVRGGVVARAGWPQQSGATAAAVSAAAAAAAVVVCGSPSAAAAAAASAAAAQLLRVRALPVREKHTVREYGGGGGGGGDKVEEVVEDEGVPGTGAVLAPAGGKVKATKSIVWLHGLGDSSEGFVPFFDYLLNDLDQQDGGRFAGVRVRLPDAPMMPVTVNGGMVMRAWYDIISMGARTDPREFDEAGVQASARRIRQIVEAEARLVGGAENVLVGGFSQGGVLATLSAYPFASRLAGVVSHSAFVWPTLSGEEHVRKGANAKTPLLAFHGLRDDVIHAKWAFETYERLRDESGWAAWSGNTPAVGAGIAAAAAAASPETEGEDAERPQVLTVMEDPHCGHNTSAISIGAFRAFAAATLDLKAPPKEYPKVNKD